MSGRTSVSGSSFVEKTKMNEKFDMYWDTRLNWGTEARFPCRPPVLAFLLPLRGLLGFLFGLVRWASRRA